MKISLKTSDEMKIRAIVKAWLAHRASAVLLQGLMLFGFMCQAQ